MTDLSKCTTREQLFRSLKDNRAEFAAQKKAVMKCADAVAFNGVAPVGEKTDAAKSAALSVAELLVKDRISVRSVINTTNLMDSHGDVHIPGLWAKSLKTPKNLYLLQEHEATFDHIISDEVRASAIKMTWRELGFDYQGSTEALVFDSEVEKSRNPFMFEQYARGYVKNHSVGMRYVQLLLCLNSEDKYYREEKENWDKYISEAANREEVEAAGYFWAVTEAKVVEGSAVPLGSNWITPTQSVKEYNERPEGVRKSIFSRLDINCLKK
jgi:hypothetical protein